MKTTFFKYVLVATLVLGGVAGLIWATQTYAGFPLHFPASPAEIDCPGCVVDESSGEFLPPTVKPAIPREWLVEGTIVSVKEDTIVVSSTKRGLVTLHILPETEIWKGKWDNTASIEVGDFFYGHGKPNEDGTVFAMEQLEINVVNLRGGITRVMPTTAGLALELRESRSEQIEIVYVDTETMIATENGSYPFGERPVEFRVDDGVQIIGVRLKDGTVLASTIF